MNWQFGLVVRAEVTKAFRAPSFSIPTILLPVGFYVLFGLLMTGAAGGSGPSYLLATYVVFAAMAPGLFGIGVTLAQERTSGWVDLLTASPAKPALFLAGRIAMALVFTALSSGMILLLAATIGKVELAFWRWIGLLLMSLFAAIPFAALGLTFGTLSGKGASALANLFFLPMAVLSGLWFPLQVLPESLQVTASFLPAYHVAQMSLRIVQDAQPITWPTHISAVLLWIAVPPLLLLLAGSRRSSVWSRQRSSDGQGRDE